MRQLGEVKHINKVRKIDLKSILLKWVKQIRKSYKTAYDKNWFQLQLDSTQNHLVRKQTLNHLAKFDHFSHFAEPLGQFGQMVECLFKN